MEDQLQVFGYGSLLWKPDLEYSECKIGYIAGYKRRFWQGSVTHRGTQEKWGRVATIIPTGNPEDKVWGVTYVVTDQTAIQKGRAILDKREISTGGYVAQQTDFYPRDMDLRKTLKVVVYFACEGNDLFWREDNIDTMAEQVVSAVGFAGTNIEYVTKMADFVRSYIPQDHDQHLFSLDEKVRALEEKLRVKCPTPEE